VPLDAMREQLRYWKQKREAAERAGNATRVTQCEHFIRQCEKVIDALEQSQLPQVPQPPKPKGLFG